MEAITAASSDPVWGIMFSKATLSISLSIAEGEKMKDIEHILNVLEVDLDETNIPPLKRNELLERLRVYTTRLGDLGPLLTKRGVSICCRYGFDGAYPTTDRIALRCLCNILFLAESTRQMFVDENYLKETTERMKTGHPDDQLLSARLLLLCTYGTNLNFDPLFEKYHIAKIINTNISCHAKLVMSTAAGSLLPAAAVSACTESLKLLYNLTAHYPHQAPRFSDSLLPILKMLNNVPIPSPPLQPLVSSLINSLTHLDLECKNSRHTSQNPLFPPFDNNINVNRLAHILDLASQAYNDEDMDKYGSPLVQVLLRIAEFAPSGPKAHLQSLLLPSDRDREGVLGRDNSLPARLLRLSTSLLAPHLRELIPALFFELSDKKVERFVHNVGYGFAAGFLLSKGIQLPPSAFGAWSTKTTEGGNAEEVEMDDKAEARNGGNSTKEGTETLDINPVTGQRRDMETKIHMPDMTDEEKEREAERLFVLFERLRATGVVNVENPVAQAARQGRFEEID